VLVNQEWVEARISISLPARGRSILGNYALGILSTSLPYVVQKALLFDSYDLQDVTAFVECVEDQDHLRSAIVNDSCNLF
jgi:predicted ABC-class ATPase